MHPIVITGISTDVGKTVAAAIIVEALGLDYWKPVQCGYLEATDTQTVQQLVSNRSSHFHPEAYRLHHPVSPHHAARLENIDILPSNITLPKSKNRMAIEGAGGLMVPLTSKTLMIDLFASWDPIVILVSKHYLGSINHTLLSIEALKSRNMKVGGIIFNGTSNPDTEQAITSQGQLPVIGRLEQEPCITHETIKKYADLWTQTLNAL